jgi:hypothetical protein
MSNGASRNLAIAALLSVKVSTSSLADAAAVL